jgi:hypothetical protein
MKILVFASFFTLTSIFYGQESYEFKNPVPPIGEQLEAFPQTYYGNYENKETGTEFIVNSSGITMVSIIHSYITQEQIRESSKYTLRGGYLFGIVENDSVLYIQEGDKYYFGIKNIERLNDSKNGAIIKKINEKTFVINFKENSGFSPSLLTFTGKSLSLRHFDYPSETKIFDVISNKTNEAKGKLNSISLDPSQKEWEKLDQKIIFGKENVFFKK